MSTLDEKGVLRAMWRELLRSDRALAAQLGETRRRQTLGWKVESILTAVGRSGALPGFPDFGSWDPEPDPRAFGVVTA